MTRNLLIALCLSGGLLAMASGPATADVTRDGRIYGLDQLRGTVTIDENQLKIPPDLEIHGLEYRDIDSCDVSHTRRDLAYSYERGDIDRFSEDSDPGIEGGTHFVESGTLDSNLILDLSNHELKLLLLEHERRQVPLEPLQRILLSLQLVFRELDLRHTS